MGLVLSDADYKVQHNDTVFPAYLTRPGAYPKHKVRAFVIANVEDTWVCEHHDPITAYSYVPPRLHSLDILALRNSMCTMHKNTEGIPEYINALEDAQKCSKHAGTTNAFTDHDLLIIANAA
eukprot:491156-Ditylum_brightwellii.AAC.1